MPFDRLCNTLIELAGIPSTSGHEEQIRTYLKNTLPDRDVNQTYDFIKSVHNLPELAERPLTLSLIAKQLVRLEQIKAAGKPVISGSIKSNVVRRHKANNLVQLAVRQATVWRLQ